MTLSGVYSAIERRGSPTTRVSMKPVRLFDTSQRRRLAIRLGRHGVRRRRVGGGLVLIRAMEAPLRIRRRCLGGGLVLIRAMGAPLRIQRRHLATWFEAMW
jgi:hypothetical protein